MSEPDESVRRLEELLAQLAEFFGPTQTVGGLRALVMVTRLVSEGEQLSISEITRMSGVPRQTVSRWVKYYRDAGRLDVVGNPEDERERYLITTDEEQLIKRMEQLASFMEDLEEQFARPGRNHSSGID